MSKDDLIIIDDEENEKSDQIDTIVIEDAGSEEAVVDTPDKFKGRVTQNGENITVKLAHPKEYTVRKNGTEQKRTLSEVTFRPVNCGDMQETASFRDEQQRGIQILIRISDLSAALFRIVDVRDIRFCSEAINHFLSDGP